MTDFTPLYETINALRDKVHQIEADHVTTRRDMEAVARFLSMQDAEGDAIPVNIQIIISKYHAAEKEKETAA